MIQLVGNLLHLVCASDLPVLPKRCILLLQSSKICLFVLEKQHCFSKTDFIFPLIVYPKHYLISLQYVLPTFSAPLFDIVYSTGQNNIPSVVFSGTPIFEL